jgi:hypothetical protein
LNWLENLAELSTYSVNLVDKSNMYAQVESASLTIKCAKLKLRNLGRSEFPNELKVPYFALKYLRTHAHADAELYWDYESASWASLSKNVMMLALTWDFRNHEVRGILVHPSPIDKMVGEGLHHRPKIYERVGSWDMELRISPKGAKATLEQFFRFKQSTITLI